MSEPRALPPDVEESIARYRARAMSDAERAAFEQRVLADDALAEALYAEISLAAIELPTALPAASVVALPRAPRRTPWLLPLAAAVLAVTALAWWAVRGRTPAPVDDRLRGVPPMTALAPSGTLAEEPAEFRWSRDPAAANYRVELYDAAGNLAGTAVSRDTVLAFGVVAHDTISAGEWRVVAIGPDGLDRPASARAAFRVVAR